jgi:hypothetical protein
MRLSLGRWTTQPDIDTAAELLAGAAAMLRRQRLSASIGQRSLPA